MKVQPITICCKNMSAAIDDEVIAYCKIQSFDEGAYLLNDKGLYKIRYCPFCGSQIKIE